MISLNLSLFLLDLQRLCSQILGQTLKHVRLRRYLRWKLKQIKKIRRRKRMIQKLPRDQIGVELGVWKGDHAKLLWDHATPISLLLVDTWKVKDETIQHGAFEHVGRIRQEMFDQMYENVKKRFANNSWIKVLRMDTVEASKGIYTGFGHSAVDWVYVDADHTYEGCYRDMEAWWPKIRPGGVMFGDDYCLGYWWKDGVIKAVNRFAYEQGVPLEIYGDQWRIVKPRSWAP